MWKTDVSTGTFHIGVLNLFLAIWSLNCHCLLFAGLLNAYVFYWCNDRILEASINNLAFSVFIISVCLDSNIWVFLCKPKLAVTHQLFWLTKKIPRDYFTTPGTPEQMGHHRFLDPPQARPLTPIPLSLFPPYLPGYPGQKQQRASWLLPLLYFCLKHVQSVTKSYQFYPLRIFDCYCPISFLHYFLPGLLYFLSSS